MMPDILQQFIDDAEQGKPELTPKVVNMDGFSSPKVRRLLNRLCSQPGASYLEIGVHTGSTLIPALYGNQAAATAIDNWSLMGEEIRNGLKANVRRFLPKREINFIEADCFTIDPVMLKRSINVYFYDGDHSKEAQYKAITYFAPILASEFVLVVDDCNWEEPREETKHALNDLHYKVVKSWLLPGAYNGDTAGWWNGLYVGLIEK